MVKVTLQLTGWEEVDDGEQGIPRVTVDAEGVDIAEAVNTAIHRLSRIIAKQEA